MRAKFDATHSVKDNRFQVGAYVMALPDTRNSKLEPRYEGPYRVVHATKGGSYQLLDADESLLSRRHSPQQLKLISAEVEFNPTAE
ncbi:hypothetical protein HDU79_004258, partial [Rhizoclosmatium sp. JEL0117]